MQSQARTMQSLTQVYNCNQIFSLGLTANIEKANIKNKKILINHTTACVKQNGM
jgi:hypothetical protein